MSGYQVFPRVRTVSGALSTTPTDIATVCPLAAAEMKVAVVVLRCASAWQYLALNNDGSNGSAIDVAAGTPEVLPLLTPGGKILVNSNSATPTLQATYLGADPPANV
jgi:hypothetical protein